MRRNGIYLVYCGLILFSVFLYTACQGSLGGFECSTAVDCGGAANVVYRCTRGYCTYEFVQDELTGYQREVIQAWERVQYLERAPQEFYGDAGSGDMYPIADKPPIDDGRSQPACIPSKQMLVLDHDHKVYGVAFSKDGKSLYTATDGLGAKANVFIWNPQTGKAFKEFPFHTSIYHMALAPSGTTLLLSGYHSSGDPRTVAELSLDTGKLETRLKDQSSLYGAYHQNGKMSVVTSAFDYTVAIWENGIKRRSWVAHEQMLVSAEFSPKGTLLVTGSQDKLVKLWDADTGTLKRTYMGHMAGVSHAVFSPDGKRIASASEDGTIRIWDAADDQKSPLILKGGHTGVITSLAYHPDGSLLASGGKDGVIRVWSTKTGLAVGKLIGHTSSVFRVAYSADGRQLLSGSEDKTARLWSCP